MRCHLPVVPHDCRLAAFVIITPLPETLSMFWKTVCWILPMSLLWRVLSREPQDLQTFSFPFRQKTPRYSELYKQSVTLHTVIHHPLQLFSYLTIGGNVSEVLSLQEEMYLAEPRTVSLLSLPAFTHEVVDLPWTCRGAREIPLEAVVLIPVVTILYHLFACQFCEWLLGAQH